MYFSFIFVTASDKKQWRWNKCIFSSIVYRDSVNIIFIIKKKLIYPVYFKFIIDLYITLAFFKQIWISKYQDFQLVSCCWVIPCHFMAIIPYEGERWILECVGLVLHFVPEGLSLTLITDMLIVTPIIITFFSYCNIANESGETPLDIAKRLKHTHCEELVSVASFCVFVHL